MSRVSRRWSAQIASRDEEPVQEAKVNSKESFLLVFGGPFEDKVMRAENSNKTFSSGSSPMKISATTSFAASGRSSTVATAVTNWLRNGARP